MGSSKVRRRINPKIFYNWNNSIPQNGTFYLLSRSNTKIVRAVPLELKTAVEVNMNIIQDEFMLLFAHIRWHENNCKLSGTNPIFNSEQINASLKSAYTEYFGSRVNKKIEIPIDIAHKEWLKQAKQYFGK